MRIKPDSVPPVEMDICGSLKVRIGLLDNLMRKYTNEDSLITSGSEPGAPHMKNSKHFTGEAIDIRNWGVVALSHTGRLAFFSGLAGVFDDLRFDIVEHTTHIHVEFDPVPNLDANIPRMKIKDKRRKVPGKQVPVMELIPLRQESKIRKVLNTSYNVFKVTANVVGRRYAGVEIFKKGSKKSVWDKLRDILDIIINRLKGK